MTTHEEGWAVEVRGDDFDLDDLRIMLKKPFNPWVEDCDLDGDTKLLLRSTSWNGLSEAQDVLAQAERLVQQLNGAKPILDGASKPLEAAGCAMRFDASGNRHAHIVLAAGRITIEMGRLRAISSSSGEVPQIPKPSPLQNWITNAATDDMRADLLTYLGRLTNWFDLYMAGELIKRSKGGEAAAVAFLGPDGAKFKNVMRTANFNRHAPGPQNPPPPNPETLENSRVFLRKIAPLFL